MPEFAFRNWLVLARRGFAAAIRLRTEIDECPILLAGVPSLALGLLLLFFPRSGALAIVLWIGATALAIGELEIVLGFRLRGHVSGVAAPAAGP